MRVAVLGYGLIGRERVRALVRLRDEDELVSEIAVFDPFAAAEQLKVEAMGARWCTRGSQGAATSRCRE